MTANLVRPLLLEVAGEPGAPAGAAAGLRPAAPEADEVAAAFAARGMAETTAGRAAEWSALLLEDR